MPEILRFCDIENLQKNAASLLASCLNSVLAIKDTAVLAVCGGRSASGVLNFLAKNKLDWSRIHLFLVDERYVPIDSPDSNFKLIIDSDFGQLVSNGTIQNANLHPFIAGDDTEASLAVYNELLKEYGGAIDVVLLSIGEDGHIASLFPYHDSIKDNGSDYYIFVDNSPKPPAQRISASKSLIKKCRYSILMVAGQDKQQAFCNINDEVYDEVDCPAKLVKDIPCSYILTDLNLCNRDN